MSDVARETLILAHLPLVRSLARRYANRGESYDDLVQVGTVGLIKAVDRYDPALGRELASFAAPTILGEIRRHFRDRAWSVRPPRSLQDAHAEVSAAVERLSVELGHTPSVAEIASDTGLDAEAVLDAILVGSAYRPLSLSRPPAGSDEEDPIELGIDDTGFAIAEERATLGDGLLRLPARERIILHLRFGEGLSQSQIAARVGISQMHVSRLIRRALETLREQIGSGG
jgi:RNA polymerase sigma-B factor